MLRTLRPSNRAIGAFPNVSKVFYSNSLTVGFGLAHNPFGDDMVGIAFEPGFFAREFLEVAFRILRTTLLKALAQGLMSFAVGFNKSSSEGLARTVRGKIDDAQVNAQCSLRLPWLWLRNIKRHSQVERSIVVEQISLPFNGIQARLLIVAYAEGNQDTPLHVNHFIPWAES